MSTYANLRRTHGDIHISSSQAAGCKSWSIMSIFCLSGERRLRNATNAGNSQCLLDLLQTGVDPNSADELGRTALR